MRNPGLLAFGITTCALVPAALHHLTAGPKQVAKLTAPSSNTFEIDGHKVELSVDKTTLDAGGVVKVKLAGAVPAGKRATMEVLVWESTGSGGGRAETPPRTLERESVTLVGSAKGAVRELSFTLPGNRGIEMSGRPHYARYDIVVVSPKMADTLERLAKRARRVDGMEDPSGVYGAWAEQYYTARYHEGDGEGTLGATGRVTVLTRPNSTPVAIAMPARLTAGEAATVKVRVTNPSKKKLSTTVSLSVPTSLQGAYLGLVGEDVAIATDKFPVELGPWATREVSFKVTPGKAGTLGLYARVSCAGDNDDDAWSTCYKVGDGQLEASEVVAAKPALASR